MNEMRIAMAGNDNDQSARQMQKEDNADYAHRDGKFYDLLPESID